MTTERELSRRLGKMEYVRDNEPKLFIIDNIGKNGIIEYSEDQLEALKAQAIAKDPFAPIYIIDFDGAGRSLI